MRNEITYTTESYFQIDSSTWDFGEGNTFQNRSVSSPAPVTMVC